MVQKPAMHAQSSDMLGQILNRLESSRHGSPRGKNETDWGWNHTQRTLAIELLAMQAQILVALSIRQATVDNLGLDGNIRTHFL